MKKCFACVMILVMGLSACAPRNWDPESWFPLWEEAGAVIENQEGITGKLAGVLPYDMSRWPESAMGEQPDEDWSILRMKLNLELPQPIPPAPGWRIDFYYQDAWHTVYREQEPVWDQSLAALQQSGEHDALFPLPSRVLEKPGKYRLCYKEMGTFPFSIFASKIWG